MYLTTRRQIAMAMNFGKYPVLYIDREDHHGFEDSDFAKGCDVRMKLGDGRFHNGYLIFSEGKYMIQSEMICLDGSFGRYSVMEMYKNANAPLVWRDTPVIIVEDYPKREECAVRVMYLPDKKFDIFCQTAAVLVPIEDNPLEEGLLRKYLSSVA